LPFTYRFSHVLRGNLLICGIPHHTLTKPRQKLPRIVMDQARERQAAPAPGRSASGVDAGGSMSNAPPCARAAAGPLPRAAEGGDDAGGSDAARAAAASAAQQAVCRILRGGGFGRRRARLGGYAGSRWPLLGS
jgi:hypothetical protein